MLIRIFKIIFIFLPISIWGSHNRGGEITYLHLGGLTYEFTITTCTDLGSATGADRDELYLDFDLGTTFSQQEVQKVEVIKTDSQIESFSKNIGTSELKIDFLSLLAIPALSVGYEKMNNTSTAYGARMLLSFDDRNSD